MRTVSEKEGNRKRHGYDTAGTYLYLGAARTEHTNTRGYGVFLETLHYCYICRQTIVFEAASEA